MNCEIVKVANLIANASTSEIKLSFDVKNKDVIIGTCEMSIRNVFVEFELRSDKGKFSFKPRNEMQNDYFVSVNVDNSKGAKVKEEDVNRVPESILENQRPDRICEEDIVIKFEEDFSVDPPSNYLNMFQDNVGQQTAEKNDDDEISQVLNHSSPAIKRGESISVQNDDKNNSDELIIMDKEHKFIRSEVGLNLDVHTSKHSVEKLYECKVCGKTFTHENNLKRHTRIHTGEKPFECQVCGKTFADKSNFNRHERIHTGVKPFKCKVCDKTFSRKSNLNEHEKIHTGEKPFECQVCGKFFTKKSNLSVHTRIHTGKKDKLHVRFVVNVLHKSVLLIDTQESIPVRNHSNVKFVANYLQMRRIFIGIKEFILVINDLNVKFVANFLHKIAILRGIKEFIYVTNLLNVKFVIKHFPESIILMSTEEFILMKNNLNVKFVVVNSLHKI